MRLRSRNSRSMERGTDTSRPNRKRGCFSRAEARSAGRSRLNYALLRGRAGSEISEQTEGRPKPEKNAEQELGEVREGCSLLAAKRREKRAAWGRAGLTLRPSRGFFRGLLRNQGVRGFSGPRSHDPHFVPVVAKFLAAVQAGDISARALSRCRATRTGAYRDGKTVPGVPATKHGVQQLRNHHVTSTELKATKPAHPLRLHIKNEL